MTDLRTAAQQALEALALAQLNGEAGLRDYEVLEIAEAAVALEAALAEPVQEPVAIKWTLDGDKGCGYNNWLGETPFGRILITWKGWKASPDACVDEFPGGFHAYGNPNEVRAACEAEFAKRLGTAPPQRKPLTEEELEKAIREVWRNLPSEFDHTSSGWIELGIRYAERAHGIGD